MNKRVHLNKLDKGAFWHVGAAAAFRCKTPHGVAILALVGNMKTASRVLAVFPTNRQHQP